MLTTVLIYSQGQFLLLIHKFANGALYTPALASWLVPKIGLFWYFFGLLTMIAWLCDNGGTPEDVCSTNSSSSECRDGWSSGNSYRRVTHGRDICVYVTHGWMTQAESFIPCVTIIIILGKINVISNGVELMNTIIIVPKVVLITLAFRLLGWLVRWK